jgi:hypothetical protein
MVRSSFACSSYNKNGISSSLLSFRMFTVSWTGATKRCKGRAHHLNLLVTETRFGEHDLLKRHSSIRAFSLQACFFFFLQWKKPLY